MPSTPSPQPVAIELSDTSEDTQQEEPVVDSQTQPLPQIEGEAELEMEVEVIEISSEESSDTEADAEEDDDSEEEDGVEEVAHCYICFETGDQRFEEAECGHRACADCWNEWLSRLVREERPNICFFCRQPLVLARLREVRP